jgi:two-component system nitrate/nitrite sensor histidine kinase NarX
MVPVELDRLRWIAVVLPVAFILVMEAMRLLLVEGDSTQQNGHLALAAMMLIGAVTFALVMFLGIEATQRQLVRQNHELAAVNAVSTAVQGELGLDVIVDAALESVIASTGATEATIRVFAQDGAVDGERGYERHRVAAAHASPFADGGQLTPHLIDIPLSTGTTVVGRMLLHLPEGVAEPDLLATATLNNIGHQLASSIQIRQLVAGLQRRQHEDHRLYEILLQVADQGELAEVLAAVVRDARELLGADEAVMCLSEVGARAVQYDGTTASIPNLAIGATGTACVHHGSDRVLPLHDRRQHCPLRASVGDGPTLTVPVRGPDSLSYGEIWLGRRAEPAFGEREQRFLVALSDLASIAITSARMREHERQGAAVAERERIAREMHDSLAQILGVTHLRLRALGARAEIAASPAVGAEIGDLASLSEEAYRDVREAILGLREASRAGRSLTETIAAYLEKYSHQAGLTATLENDYEGELALPPRVEVQLIRVIQEALTNVRKHGAATKVVVRLTDCPTGARIEIADDGRGFDVGGTLLGRDGFGLHTMQERMELAGGTLTIESAPGHGTRVIAIVPVAATVMAAR